MQSFLRERYPPTVVLRHRRENLKKCSLKGLESRDDFRFLTYPKDPLPRLTHTVLLTLGAPELSPDDTGCGLLILDATWRYAEKMFRFVTEQQTFVLRSLPNSWVTAYPRRQQDCPDPELGLASVEAVYAAYTILGRDTTGLLNHYHWKHAFLKKNNMDHS